MSAIMDMQDMVKNAVGSAVDTAIAKFGSSKRSTLSPPAVRHVIGCMTGTSIDGIDVAMCRVEGTGILNMRCTCLATFSADMPDELSFTLRAFADKDAALTAKQLCEVQRDFCMLHVRAIKSLMEQFHEANPVWATQHSIDLVSVHGQTVYHAPPLYSYQMFTAAPLSHELGMTVVCDLRAADVAAGGQGAPAPRVIVSYISRLFLAVTSARPACEPISAP